MNSLFLQVSGLMSHEPVPPLPEHEPEIQSEELQTLHAEGLVLEGDLHETLTQTETVSSMVDELEASVQGAEAFLTAPVWNPAGFKAVYDRASELTRNLGFASPAVLGAECLTSQGLTSIHAYAGTEGFVDAVKGGIKKLIALLNDLIDRFKAWVKNLLGRKSTVERRNEQILKGAKELIGKDAERIEFKLTEAEKKVFYLDHNGVLKMVGFPKDNNLVMNTVTDILEAATKMKTADDVMSLKPFILKLKGFIDSGKILQTTRTHIQGKMSSSTLSLSEGVRFQMSGPEGNDLATPKDVAQYLRDTWIVLAGHYTDADAKEAITNRKQLQSFLEESQSLSKTLPDARATVDRVRHMITNVSGLEKETRDEGLGTMLVALQGALQLHVGLMQRYVSRVVSANEVTGELVRRGLEKLRKEGAK